MNLAQLLVWSALLLVPQFSDATIPLPALTALIPAGLIAVPTGQLLLGLGLIGVKISLASRLLGYLTSWYGKRSSGRGLSVKNQFVHIPTKSVKPPALAEPLSVQSPPLPVASEPLWLPQARQQPVFNAPYFYASPVYTYPAFQPQAFPPPSFSLSKSFSSPAPNNFNLNVHKSVSGAQPPIQFVPPAPMAFSVSKSISHSPTQTDFSFRKSVANAPPNVDINFSKSISHVPTPVSFSKSVSYSQPAVAHHQLPAGHGYALHPVPPSAPVPVFPTAAKPAKLQSITGGTFDQLLRLAKSPAVSTLISNNPDLIVRILQSIAGPGARMDMTVGGNLEALLNFVRRDPALVRQIIKADPEFVPTILNRILGDTVSTIDSPPPPPPPVEDANGDSVTNGTSEEASGDANVPANVPVDADGWQANHPSSPYYQGTGPVHPNFGLHVQQGGFGFPNIPPSSSPHASAYYHTSKEDSSRLPLVLSAEDMAYMKQLNQADYQPSRKSPAQLSSEVQEGFDASKAEKDSEGGQGPSAPVADTGAREPITQAAVPASTMPVYVPAKGHYRSDPVPAASTLDSVRVSAEDVPVPESRTGVSNETSSTDEKGSPSREPKSVPLLATIRRRRRSAEELKEQQQVDNGTKGEAAEHLIRGYFSAVRTLDSRKCIFKMVCFIGANDKPFGRYGASLASFFGGFSSMLKIEEITSGYSRAFETGRTHGQEGCRIKYNTCPMRIINLISLATNFS